MGGEFLAADAVEICEGADLLRGRFAAGGVVLDRGDHQVFSGVFGGDELKNFRAVSGPFEEERAQGVGDEFGLSLLKDTVS